MTGVAELYGKTEVVYNIHGLLHLSGDAERFGCLEEFSSFCFENKLKEIKGLVRKGHFPLQQVARRLAECERAKVCAVLNEDGQHRYLVSSEHRSGPVPEGLENSKQYRKLAMNGFTILSNQRDGCVQLSDKSVVLVQNILEIGRSIYVVYKKFRTSSDQFTFPLPSSSLGIFRVSDIEQDCRFCAAGDIVCKCMLLALRTDCLEEFACFPLRHL